MTKHYVDSTGEEIREGLYYHPGKREILFCIPVPDFPPEFKTWNGFSSLSYKETMKLVPITDPSFFSIMQRNLDFGKSKLESKLHKPNLSEQKSGNRSVRFHI